MLRSQDFFLRKAQAELKTAFQSRDMLLGHTARAIDELHQTTHLLAERLQSIHRLYFPEMDVKDPKKFA